jgi:hypothetical protein
MYVGGGGWNGFERKKKKKHVPSINEKNAGN